MSGRRAPRRTSPPGLRGPASAATDVLAAVDRIGLGAVLGGRACCCCAIAAAIVLYMLVRGLQYLRLDLLFTPSRSRTSTRARRGGFLDPIIGTFILTVARHRDRRADRGRDRGLADRVRRARRGWRARSSRASRSSPARPSIVLAIFGLLVFQQELLRLPVLHGRGRRGVRPLVPHRRGDDVADRAAAGRRRDARGAAGDPAPRARGLLRARQDARPRRSAACCCPAARPGIATGTALGMGRIAGDTAIVVILLGATLQLAGARATPPLLDMLRGHRQHAHQLRLQQLAGRRGQRAREGLRGGVRAAA